jgi:hypothetical protein
MYGPWSYINYYQNANRPIVREIEDSYLKLDSIITYFPRITEHAIVKKTKRVIGGTPTPTWTKYGVEPSTSFATPTSDYEEGLALMRDKFQIDKALKTDKWYVLDNPVNQQIKEYIEARKFEVQYRLINNDQSNPTTGNPDAPDGFKARVTKSLYGNNPAVNFQGTADLSDSGLSATSSVRWQRDWHRMAQYMGCGDMMDGVIAIVSPQVYRQLTAVVMAGGTTGGFRIDKDALGRVVLAWRECVIVNAGYQAPVLVASTPAGGPVTATQSTPNISDAEDANGWSTGDPLYNASGAVYSSVYFVWTGEKRFCLWQQEEPWMVEERVPGTWQYYVLLDMSIGIWNVNTRALGRIYGNKTNGPTQS